MFRTWYVCVCVSLEASVFLLFLFEPFGIDKSDDIVFGFALCALFCLFLLCFALPSCVPLSSF